MRDAPGREQPLSKLGHMALRLLLSSYFIGMATGVVPYEPGRALAEILVPAPYSQFAFAAFLFTTSFLIIVRPRSRGAALLLANFVFWSAWHASFGAQGTRDVAEFWRDLTLVGALFLTYAPSITSENGRLPTILRRIVTPRRVVATHDTLRPVAHPATLARSDPPRAVPPKTAKVPQVAKEPDEDIKNIFQFEFDVA